MLPSLARLVLETETKRGIDDADAPETPGRAKQARTRNIIPAATLTDLDRELHNLIVAKILDRDGSVHSACKGVLNFCASHRMACDEETWRLACGALHLHDVNLRNQMLRIQHSGVFVMPPKPWAAAFRMLCIDLKRSHHLPKLWLETMGGRPSKRAKNMLLDRLDVTMPNGPLVTLLRLMGAEPGRTGEYRQLDARLRDAVANQNLDEVRRMLKTDADVNNLWHDETVLMSASHGGHLAVVNVLLAAGAEVDKMSFDGMTALMKASRLGHVDIIKALLDNGANVNMVDKSGNTALMFASWMGHIAVVNELLAKGANVNVVNDIGWTALMKASDYGHAAVVKELLEASDIRVNMADKFGNTALIKASTNGRDKVVKMLLDGGADVNVVNNNRQTALMLADNYGHAAVAALLRDAGAT